MNSNNTIFSLIAGAVLTATALATCTHVQAAPRELTEISRSTDGEIVFRFVEGTEKAEKIGGKLYYTAWFESENLQRTEAVRLAVLKSTCDVGIGPLYAFDHGRLISAGDTLRDGSSIASANMNFICSLMEVRTGQKTPDKAIKELENRQLNDVRPGAKNAGYHF